MRTSYCFDIILHYPDSEADIRKLKKRKSDIVAQALVYYLNSQPISKEAKLQILEHIIETGKRQSEHAIFSSESAHRLLKTHHRYKRKPLCTRIMQRSFCF